MGITYQITDTAHLYGLDNMSANAALTSAYMAILGTDVSSVYSWGTGPLPVGRGGIITVTSSGGFTEEFGLTNIDGTNYVLSTLQLLRTNELLLSASGSVYFTSANYGTALSQENILSGSDKIYGNSYNNVLTAFGGNDRIDGGGGINTAVFRGISSEYQITKNGAAFSVTGPDGTDTLINIQRLQFDDNCISYDITGNAGQVYRMYQAALNRTPDIVGLGYWINQMDHGVTLTQIAGGFTGSAEFHALYGANQTDADFISALYSNVLHRTPDAGGNAYWMNELGTHKTREQVLVGFSESTENQANLISVIGNGIVTTPLV